MDRTFTALLFLALFAVGCAHRPPVEVAQFGQAEAAVARAEAGPAAEAGGAHLTAARRELSQARAASRRGDRSLAEAHSYAAERAAQAAEATAGLVLAQRQAERATDALMSDEAHTRGSAEGAGREGKLQAGGELHTLVGALAKHAPELARDEADAGGLVVTLPGKRAFLRGSSSLLPPAKAHLRELAVAVQASGQPRVHILGRVPGTIGSPKAQRLARARTQAVLAWLMACGLPAHGLTAMPIAADEVPSARARVTSVATDLAEVHLVLQPNVAASDDQETKVLTDASERSLERMAPPDEGEVERSSP